MTIPWVKRADLIVTPHDSGGWVIKDPLTLSYTWLDNAEYLILNLLDGSISFAHLLKKVQGGYPARKLTAEDVVEFLQSLAGQQLIRQPQGDSQRLIASPQRSVFIRCFSLLARVLKIQIPLVNPSRLLDGLMPVMRAVIQPCTVMAAAIVSASALCLVMLNIGEILRQLPSVGQFLAASNVLLMLVVFVVVKVLHEAGHALTARYFGAECNECGVMLLMFTPVLYTNVTDSWVLPRWQRVLVSAAGIIVELVLASVCCILWWYASAGVTKAILLNVMMLCSVNTLLFNGNPLLRFDGYFILADLTGIPNLAARSSARLQAVLIDLLTGKSAVPQHEERRTTLLAYGALSTIYRAFLTLAILRLIAAITDQWHLGIAGKLLSAVVIAGFVVIPAAGFLHGLLARSRESGGGRSYAGPVLAILVLVATLFCPLPQTVVAPAIVRPVDRPVYAPLSGRLVGCADYGSRVEEGEVLVELQNPELEQAGQELQHRVIEIEQQLSTLKSSPATASSELIPALAEALRAARAQLTNFRMESAGLLVIADRSGRFLPPAAVSRQTRDDLPELWHDTPAQAYNLGAWIERGTTLGYQSTDSQRRLEVFVTEDCVEYVQPQQSVQFRPGAGGVGLQHGKVVNVAPLQSKTVPAQLLNQKLVSGRMEGDSVRPSAVTFAVDVELSPTTNQHPAALYSTGEVRIRVASASLATRFLRYLRQTF